MDYARARPGVRTLAIDWVQGGDLSLDAAFHGLFAHLSIAETFQRSEGGGAVSRKQPHRGSPDGSEWAISARSFLEGIPGTYPIRRFLKGRNGPFQWVTAAIGRDSRQ